MDPSLVKQALEAIEKGDSNAALEILKGLVAAAAGAEPEPDGDEPGSENDGAEGQPEMQAAPPAKDGGDDGDDDEDEDGMPEKKAARKAMRLHLQRMTGAKTMAEALATVEVFRTSHLTLETERQKLAKERQTIEAAERRDLCVQLVKLGAEFPSTVWADSSSKKPSALKLRWKNMPIDELRAHVAEQTSARGGKRESTQKVEPARDGDGGVVVELSAEEQRICAEMKCDPKVYARLKAQRDGKGA